MQAFAAANDLRSAAKYYKQLRRSGRSGLAAVSVSHRRMWELLIESYCRQVRAGQGLGVCCRLRLQAVKDEHALHAVGCCGGVCPAPVLPYL